MPAVRVSIDRRSFRYVTDTFNDDSVYNLVCMVCAQSKTHTGLHSVRVNGFRESLSEISYRKGQDLIRLWKQNVDHFDNNFGFRSFVQRYGQNGKIYGSSDEDLREFGPTKWEWRRLLKIPGRREAFELLCCPEDIKCSFKHDSSEICPECDVPVCAQCMRTLNCNRNVPMALSNDNMWGYIADLVTKYQVRWIEMAAVLPYWTCMIVYYVEADRGHLMTEVLKDAQHRTAVRGHAVS